MDGQSFFGFVEQPMGLGAGVLAKAEACNPAIEVVVNAPERAYDLATRFPETLVITRRFWPHPDFGDDNLHLEIYPDVWVNEMEGWSKYAPNLVFYAGNEPNTDLETLAGWTMGALDEADQLGRRLCVLNFGVGWPEKEAWTGVLRPVVERVIASKGKHVIGVHEYFGGTSWETWVDKRRYMTGSLLVGRVGELLAAFPNLDPWWVCITEWGADKIAQIPDSGPWKTIGLAQDMYFGQMMGAYWGLYQNWGVRGAAIFTLGTNGNDERWGPWDVSQADELLGMIANGKWGTWRKQMETKWVQNKQAGKTVNVRERPATRDTAGDVPIIGEIPAGGRWLEIDLTSTPREGNDYTWRQVHNPDYGQDDWGNLGSGWVAMEVIDVLDFQPGTEPEEPGEPTDPEEPTEPTTPVDFDNLVDALKDAYVQAENAGKALAEFGASLQACGAGLQAWAEEARAKLEA